MQGKKYSTDTIITGQGDRGSRPHKLRREREDVNPVLPNGSDVMTCTDTLSAVVPISGAPSSQLSMSPCASTAMRQQGVPRRE